MGIKTKVVKRIVRNPDVRRPSRGLLIATSDEAPTIAVVYEAGEPPLIVSVVFRTTEEYVRLGETFEAVNAS